MSKLIDSVNSPSDLKSVDKKDIPKLCGEIRSFLIEKVNKSGGHLASNLGVVELTVALHRVFDSPKDKIIFDVGHQSYVHKILTGRKGDFDTLRTPGGLSGFTSRRESLHDPFGAGHSSTALSAALGFAEANKLSGCEDFSICVVGDGAFTGGMVHEALNNCKPDLKLIFIINENRMSISKNKGAFAAYLAKVRISKGYTGWKKGTRSLLRKIPLIGKPIQAVLSFVKNKIKRVVYSNNYFEDMGLYYIGPVDGNDYNAVERALTDAKDLGKCSVIHLYTKKGKGYEPAESFPDSFHSVGKSLGTVSSFHGEFARELVALAEEDENIVAVTAAMGIGTGLDLFEERFKDRYFDVGIAESHALTFSAGLAAAGKKPFVAIYSTFLQRGYDNIVHDIALQKLPVRIMIDRAGLAAKDGPTHHGIFDVSFIMHIPGVRLIAPATYGSLRLAVREAAGCDAPIAIRYPNCAESEIIDSAFFGDGDATLAPRCDYSAEDMPRVLFVTYGDIAKEALAAEDILRDSGISAGTVLIQELKGAGYNIADKIISMTEGAECLIFQEEGILNGGFFQVTLSEMRNKGFSLPCSILAIDGHFAMPDEHTDIYEYAGIGRNALASRAIMMLKNDN